MYKRKEHEMDTASTGFCGVGLSKNEGCLFGGHYHKDYNV